MVRGLDKFKQYFQEYASQYVIIGGTACDILFTELGVPFRATKDLDMVLIVEELNPSFGQTLKMTSPI
jgi:predicted nucleotidyltransferase